MLAYCSTESQNGSADGFSYAGARQKVSSYFIKHSPRSFKFVCENKTHTVDRYATTIKYLNNFGFLISDPLLNTGNSQVKMRYGLCAHIRFRFSYNCVALIE